MYTLKTRRKGNNRRTQYSCHHYHPPTRRVHKFWLFMTEKTKPRTSSIIIVIVIMIIMVVDKSILFSALPVQSVAAFGSWSSTTTSVSSVSSSSASSSHYRRQSIHNFHHDRIKPSHLVLDSNSIQILQPLNRKSSSRIRGGGAKAQNKSHSLLQMGTKGLNDGRHRHDSNNNKREKKGFHELHTKVIQQLQMIHVLGGAKSLNDANGANGANGTNGANDANDAKSIGHSVKVVSMLEKDILNTIWSCHSIFQIHLLLTNVIANVKWLLQQQKQQPRKPFDHNGDTVHDYFLTEDDLLHQIINEQNSNSKNNSNLDEYELKLIGPNIAAAALRRMVSINIDSTTTRRNTRKKCTYNRKYTNNSSEEHEEIMNVLKPNLEIEMGQVYIPTLLQLLSNEIVNCQEVENSVQSSSSSSSSSSTSSFRTFEKWAHLVERMNHKLSLLEEKSQIPQPSSRKKYIFQTKMTNYSLVNIMYSISALYRDINRKKQQHQKHGQSQQQRHELHLHYDLYYLVQEIASLLLLQQEKQHDSHAACSVTQLTPKRCLETLTSIATIEQLEESSIKKLSQKTLLLLPPTTTSLSSLSYMNDNYDNDNINKNMKGEEYDDNNIITSLIHIIGNRLHKGDAISQFNGKDLSLGLWSLYMTQTFHLQMIKSFTRKLRKKNIRNGMSHNDICRAIWSIGQLVKLLKDRPRRHRQNQVDRYVDDDDSYYFNSIDSSELTNSVIYDEEETSMIYNECETCLFTLMNELPREDGSKNKNDDMSFGGGKYNSAGQSKIYALQGRQLADILSTCVVFEVNVDKGVVSEIISNFVKLMMEPRYHVSATDISRILWSLQRLKVINQEELTFALIHQYNNLVQRGITNAVVPKTLTMVLRSIVMMLPHYKLKDCDLIKSVIPLLYSNKFLQKCNEFEVSNLMFVLTKANTYDESAVKALAKRMIEDDILDSCTTSSASRFLWSFSSLVSAQQNYKMEELLFQTFQALGGILLSSDITPIDASSAMWAIAKSSYSLDMGVFDHLAEILAEDSMLERASVQQICYALWSCGKMTHFEDTLKEKMEFGEVTPPPYYKYATKYATFLVSLIDQMSSKDVAQVRTSVFLLGIM